MKSSSIQSPSVAIEKSLTYILKNIEDILKDEVTEKIGVEDAYVEIQEIQYVHDDLYTWAVKFFAHNIEGTLHNVVLFKKICEGEVLVNPDDLKNYQIIELSF